MFAPGKAAPAVVEEPLPEEIFQCPTTSSSPEAHASGKPEVGKSLTWDQHSSIEGLLREFADVFSDVPGHCTTLEHAITLTTTDRLQSKLYPVPVHLQPSFRQEVETLLQQGIT